MPPHRGGEGSREPRVKVRYGRFDPIPAREGPRCLHALEARGTSAGVRSRRAQVRVLLRARERTWRNGWRTCLISRRLVVRIHPFVRRPWSKIRAPGCEPGGTGESPVGHPTGGSRTARRRIHDPQGDGSTPSLQTHGRRAGLRRASKTRRAGFDSSVACRLMKPALEKMRSSPPHSGIRPDLSGVAHAEEQWPSNPQDRVRLPDPDQTRV